MAVEIVVSVNYRNSMLRVIDGSLMVWERRIGFGFVDLVFGFSFYLMRERSLVIGRTSSEVILESYLSLLPLEAELTFPVKGRNTTGGHPTTIDVTTIEVRETAYKSVGHLANYLHFAFTKSEGSDDETIDAAYLPDRYKRLLKSQSVKLAGEFRHIRHLVDVLSDATGVRFIIASDD